MALLLLERCEDFPGDVALETADDFVLGLALGQPTGQVDGARPRGDSLLPDVRGGLPLCEAVVRPQRTAKEKARSYALLATPNL